MVNALRAGENAAAAPAIISSGATCNSQQRGMCSKSSDTIPEMEEQDQYFMTAKPEREINLFGPKDRRLPLPGNVGFAQTLENHKKQKEREFDELIERLCTKNKSDTLDVLNDELTAERHDRIFDQVVNQVETEVNEKLEAEEKAKTKAPSNLECVAHECPKLLINDFKDLFPSTSRLRPEILQRLTVVTLCQKTLHDQSAWSSAVEVEREKLTEEFVTAAQSICEILQEAGYWADFIDPTSGRFYLGPYTPATMFETDERYRHFGFSIEDLGCCKVLRHHKYGTKTFVGAVFTSAPVDAPELETIMTCIAKGE